MPLSNEDKNAIKYAALKIHKNDLSFEILKSVIEGVFVEGQTSGLDVACKMAEGKTN